MSLGTGLVQRWKTILKIFNPAALPLPATIRALDLKSARDMYAPQRVMVYTAYRKIPSRANQGSRCAPRMVCSRGGIRWCMRTADGGWIKSLSYMIRFPSMSQDVNHKWPDPWRKDHPLLCSWWGLWDEEGRIICCGKSLVIRRLRMVRERNRRWFHRCLWAEIFKKRPSPSTCRMLS